MDIKLEVRAHDENAYDNLDVVSVVPEGVAISQQGPIVERNADASTALFAFLISVAASVPSDLLAQWIAHLIASKLKPKAETVKIIVNGKGVVLDGVLLGDIQIERIVADELRIQFEKSR